MVTNANVQRDDDCPECDGEGYVTVSGTHPSRYPGGTSAMDAPDEWRERCPVCGGSGRRVEVDDGEATV